MDLQNYLDNKVRKQRDRKFAESSQWSLGQLIEELEKAGIRDEDGDLKTICFDFGSALPTDVDSWRGSYDELALGYALSGYDGNADYEECTVEKLLNELKSAIGKSFHGYKGGEYTMTNETPLWVANPGNADNTAIWGILDLNYKIVLLTEYCEF